MKEDKLVFERASQASICIDLLHVCLVGLNM